MGWSNIINLGNKKSSQGAGLGFQACGTCVTKTDPNPKAHSDCSKVDNELAKLIGLSPRDPDFAGKLHKAKDAMAATPR